MYTFESKNRQPITLSVPEHRMRISPPGEEPARYRIVQSAELVFKDGTFKTSDELTAERIRQESGFGTWYFETTPKKMAAPAAAAPAAAPAPAALSDDELLAEMARRGLVPAPGAEDGNGESGSGEDAGSGEAGNSGGEAAPTAVAGVTSLQGAAEVLMAAPYDVAREALVDKNGRLNAAKVRSAADGARVAFPDLFDGPEKASA